MTFEELDVKTFYVCRVDAVDEEKEERSVRWMMFKHICTGLDLYEVCRTEVGLY